LVPYVLKANTRKFLFGTDYPFISPQRWLTEFRALCPNAEAFGKVTGTNIQQVLKV
jgi:predicted TIM-barrel fold metal-dependent hydrolase